MGILARLFSGGAPKPRQQQAEALPAPRQDPSRDAERIRSHKAASTSGKMAAKDRGKKGSAQPQPRTRSGRPTPKAAAVAAVDEEDEEEEAPLAARVTRQQRTQPPAGTASRKASAAAAAAAVVPAAPQQRSRRGQPAAKPAPAEQQQQPQKRVRLADGAPRRSGRQPPQQQASSSSSDEEEKEEEEERPEPSGHRAQPAAAGDPTRTGMKRVRSSWKMRPLIIDEKLNVFIEGQDEELLHYDGGEFYQWLKDCEAGQADPADGCPYPLLVQDQDLRTLLEIKPPEAAGEGATGTAHQQHAGAKRQRTAAPGGGGGGIVVPGVRRLPPSEQPDLLVREQGPSVVQRAPDASPPELEGRSTRAAQAAAAAWSSAERALAEDPCYIRYVQPTPDDMDLAVEYDLDEEDEEWLEEYNEGARKAKSRKAKRMLGEEWMEHLMDRMEKEYTAALQRHPEKWVVQRDPGSPADAPPTIVLPSIDEAFPLEACLQVPGINHYENVIACVYEYWRGKHQRAGRPLIQRLWYEPPWHRHKAAQRLAADEEDGPFAAHDSPAALANIRKRRMEPAEVKTRFEELRRDLEAARTLADQVRKREKLKKRELQLYKEEWAARMQAIADGTERVIVRHGQLVTPPPQLSTLRRLEAAAFGALSHAPSSDLDSGDEVIAVAEDRAARLAHRRHAREAAALGVPLPPPPARPAAAAAAAQPRRHAAASAAQHAQQQQRSTLGALASLGGLKQGGNVRGPPPPPGVRRIESCWWCHSDEFLMLGCATCPRCFCFKCFQHRPGFGINNWSRAVKDTNHRCVVCRGLEHEQDTSANTADQMAPACDAADATTATVRQQRGRGAAAAALQQRGAPRDRGGGARQQAQQPAALRGAGGVGARKRRHAVSWEPEAVAEESQQSVSTELELSDVSSDGEEPQVSSEEEAAAEEEEEAPQARRRQPSRSRPAAADGHRRRQQQRPASPAPQQRRSSGTRLGRQQPGREARALAQQTARLAPPALPPVLTKRIPRADLEVMLGQPVFTPTRKLRGRG